MKSGFCVWFTGLSASGKSTLAALLKDTLIKRGLKVKLLDGDIVRANLNNQLTFSPEDRATNLRRIASIASQLLTDGTIVIVSTISPYRNIRREVKDKIKNLISVYTNSPLEKCMERDPKKLYEKAKAGKIKQFTGLDDVYETPLNADLELYTDKESPAESLARLVEFLEKRGLI